MGLSLYGRASNRPITVPQLDGTINKARKHHAHYEMIAKRAKIHLTSLQIATNALEALTSHIQDLKAQQQEFRAGLVRSRAEYAELIEELEWSHRNHHHHHHHHRAGCDVTYRNPDAVEVQLAALAARIEDQMLACDGLQKAEMEKREALVVVEAECRNLVDVTEMCAAHIGNLADDLELKPLTLRWGLDGDDDGSGVITPMAISEDRGTGEVVPLTRGLGRFDELVEAARSSASTPRPVLVDGDAGDGREDEYEISYLEI